MKKLFKNKVFLAGFCMISFMLCLMVAGFIYLPYDYIQTDAEAKLLGISPLHLLGTDHLGRDVFSRIMVGIRVSLFIGSAVMLLGLFFGIIFGSVSGWFGGKIDLVIMKVINTLMSFPGILFALMLAAVFGADIKITVLAIGIMSIPRFTRITRAGYMNYKNSLFVRAARARGASTLRIMYIHILPNVIPELVVTATLTFALSILSESGLSYLGLGVQPPFPSFGRMINDAQRFIFANPCGVLIPVMFLIVLVLGFNLMGEGIRQIKK